MNIRNRLFPNVVFLLLMLVIPFVAQADSDYDGQVPPSPKAFYDVNVKDATSMLVFLGVISDTYDLLLSKGAPPAKIKFVISLRGVAVTFVTTEFLTNDPLGPQIAALIDGFTYNGVRIEACQISCEWLLPPGTELHPDVVIIDNAFASSIWYQTKGYAVINID